MTTFARVQRLTLKQLKNVKLVTPVCKVCGQRIYRVNDQVHIRGREHE